MLEYIPVTPGQRLIFKKNAISSGDVNWRYTTHNSSKSYVDRFASASDYFVWVVPTGIYYLRVSYPVASNPSIQEEMATLEKFTTLEATVNGIQTTVGGKASQTQVTQLANQLTSVAESSIKNIIKNKNFDYDVSDWVGDNITLTYEEGGYAKAYVTTANGRMYQTNVFNANNTYNIRFKAKSDTAGNIVSVGQVESLSNGTFNLTTTWQYYEFVYDSNSTNAFSIVFKDIGRYYIDEVTVYSTGAASTSKITQMSDNINARVTKNGIMTQLNINPEGILLQGRNIMLDGNVTMTNAFVDKLNVNTLSAVYADIATLKTKVLTADVITSTHLKVDNAVVDKLTATTAIVDRFFSKTAVIDQVTSKSLTAVYADIATLTTKV